MSDTVTVWVVWTRLSEDDAWVPTELCTTDTYAENRADELKYDGFHCRITTAQLAPPEGE